MCTYYVSKCSKGKYILLLEIFDKHGHIGIVGIYYLCFKLEYGAVIWHPYLGKDQLRVKIFQF